MMKLFRKHKEKIKGWDDIKLHQLQEIYTLPEYDDKLDLMINVLSILLDKDVDDIENMVVEDLFREYTKWEFLKTPPKEEMIPIIKTEKGKLGFIELDKMTLGQYTDIEEYLSDGNVMDNIHKVLATLYLPIKSYNPITKKYTLEEYKIDTDREKVFLDMGMDILYPVILFFYHIVGVYLRDFQLSLMETKMEEMRMKYQGEEQLETLSQDKKKE